MYDRNGNSYRYHRAVHKQKELEERIAVANRWNKLYEKASDIAEKTNGSEQKAI